MLTENKKMNPRVVTKVLPSVVGPVTDEHLTELAELLRLLSEPARLRILLACLPQSASVGEIALRAKLSRGLTSHHLRLLRAGRFVRAERNGKQMIYQIKDDRVLCILADLIGHVVKPPADDDE